MRNEWFSTKMTIKSHLAAHGVFGTFKKPQNDLNSTSPQPTPISTFSYPQILQHIAVLCETSYFWQKMPNSRVKFWPHMRFLGHSKSPRMTLIQLFLNLLQILLSRNLGCWNILQFYAKHCTTKFEEYRIIWLSQAENSLSIWLSKTAYHNIHYWENNWEYFSRAKRHLHKNFIEKH